MASTVSSATLKVTLKEEIELNGSQQGSTNTLSIGEVNEISKGL